MDVENAEARMMKRRTFMGSVAAAVAAAFAPTVRKTTVRPAKPTALPNVPPPPPPPGGSIGVHIHKTTDNGKVILHGFRALPGHDPDVIRIDQVEVQQEQTYFVDCQWFVRDGDAFTVEVQNVDGGILVAQKGEV